MYTCSKEYVSKKRYQTHIDQCNFDLQSNSNSN